MTRVPNELEMSLDEIIHSKDYKQRKMMSQTSSISSVEYQAMVKQTDKKLAECSLEDKMDQFDLIPISTTDMNKSLEEIIHERKILKTKGVVADSGKVTTTGRGRGKRRPPAKAVQFNLDPKTNSLDDIIAERGVRRHSSPTRFPVTNGKRTIAPEGADALNEIVPIYRKRTRTIKNPLTPHRAVTFLSERGMIIELKIGKGIDKPINTTYQQAHLWRCEVNCGDLKGLSDSCRKKVAREMACLDFLRTLAHNYKNIVIPEYEISEEVFIDPCVYHWIEKLATERSVAINYNTAIKQKEGAHHSEHQYVYVCTYNFGNDTFVAEKPNPESARLIAAKKVYESVTGSEIPRTRYSVGEKCDLNAEYDFSESEVYHVLEVDTENNISNQEALNMNGEGALEI